MKLDASGSTHLSYCTNVHPGESLGEVEQALRSHVAQIGKGIQASPFGVGLRLSALAARQLDEPRQLRQFQDLLEELGLYVFTLNGFPYGAFHGQRVKEHVYDPDWRSLERVDYSNRLARLLAALLPSKTAGSISTVPLGFRPNLARHDEPRVVANLLQHVTQLHRLREQIGCTITLGLEPEPHCYLETLHEAVDFLERGPFSAAGVQELSRLTGQSAAQAADTLRRHLGVCLDACHMTVEFEDPAETVKLLEDRGICVSKLQISAGLRCNLSGDREQDTQVLSELRSFSEDVYLHQVVERKGSQLARYLDLPDAFQAYDEAADRQPREWRIHFHVPVFLETLGRFSSTRRELQQLLALQRATPFTSHLEVETYTWDVLPRANRPQNLAQAIIHELEWSLGELGFSRSAKSAP